MRRDPSRFAKTQPQHPTTSTLPASTYTSASTSTSAPLNYLYSSCFYLYLCREPPGAPFPRFYPFAQKAAFPFVEKPDLSLFCAFVEGGPFRSLRERLFLGFTFWSRRQHSPS